MFFIKCNVLPKNSSVHRANPPSPAAATSAAGENSTFSDLMEKDLVNKKHTNAEVLTYLLNDPDPAESHTAAVIENTSKCNTVLKLTGISNKEIYNLPVPANSKNQFVIQKGSYTLKSDICGANYYSQKNIAEPLILKLSAN